MSTETITLSDTNREKSVETSALLQYLNIKPQNSMQDTELSQQWTGSNLALQSRDTLTPFEEFFSALKKYAFEPILGTSSIVVLPQDMHHTGLRHNAIPKKSLIVCKTLITDAATCEEIVAAIRYGGWNAIADRLTYLRSLVLDDPDEIPIQIESLRNLALFIANRQQQQLPEPQIGINPDGFACTEWRIANHGILAMDFLPSGQIRFAAILKPPESGNARWSVNGVLPLDHMMDAIHVFTDRLTP